MKCILCLLPVPLLFMFTTAIADRICPEGKGYQRDKCYEVRETAYGKEIIPVGKSFLRDQTYQVLSIN